MLIIKCNFYCPSPTLYFQLHKENMCSFSEGVKYFRFHVKEKKVKKKKKKEHRGSIFMLVLDACTPGFPKKGGEGREAILLR